VAAFAFVWVGIADRNWWLLAFPIYMLAVFGILVPLRGRRLFRQNKALSEAMEAEIRSDGIFFRNTNSSGLLPYSHIHKAKANSRLILIYRTSNMFHIVPRRFFNSSDDFDAFVLSVLTRSSSS
jgi:hypothetical protein